jgi:hypothetical protein
MMTDRIRSTYAGPSLAPALLLLVCCGACAAPADGDEDLDFDSAAEHEETAPGANSVRSSMRGVQLTPEQVSALQEASAQREHMSIEEVADVTGIEVAALTANSAAPAPEAGSRDVGGSVLELKQGYDDSIGDCSIIVLTGWDNGDYHFEQTVLGGRSAIGGEIVISTNGAIVVPDIWVPSGTSQNYADSLTWTGIGASATTMTGWMLTSDGVICTGDLFAHWG